MISEKQQIILKDIKIFNLTKIKKSDRQILFLIKIISIKQVKILLYQFWTLKNEHFILSFKHSLTFLLEWNVKITIINTLN